MPKKQVKKPPEPASIAIDETEWQGDTSYTTAEAAKPAGPVDILAVTAAPFSSTTTQQLTIREICEQSAMGHEEIDSVVLQLNGWQAEAMKRTQKSMGNQEEFKLASQEEEAPNRRKVFQLNGWKAEAMKRTQKSMGNFLQEEFKLSSQEEEAPNRRKKLPRPLPKPSPSSREEEEPGFELTEKLLDDLMENPSHNDELIDEIYRHPLLHEEEEPKKSMMTKRRGHEPSSDEEKEPKRMKLLPRHNEEQKLKSDALVQHLRITTGCMERNVEEYRQALKKSIPLRLRHLDSPQCRTFECSITKSDAKPSRMHGGKKLNNFQSEALITLRRLEDKLNDLLDEQEK